MTGMTDISQIDKNFIINTNIDKEDVVFHDIEEAPFNVYGVFWKDGQYRRMPDEIAKNVSSEVQRLSIRTSGGRVRFITDSEYIAIHADTDLLVKVSHFTLAGTSGLDMYVGNEHVKTFLPPQEIENGFGGMIDFGTKELREITINLPLYTTLKKLYVGLQKDAVIKEGVPYANEKPIVYYGSSITMGGCASRAGTCYQNIIAREFNYDYINLGFSGSARAEDEMIDYIKGLDMHAFVMDYDYNAPDADHLGKTHEKMFTGIREAHPNLPIIIMARPQYKIVEKEEGIARCQIVKDTYDKAIAKGDKNVYYISSADLTALCKGEGTVDGVHPNDFGFASMAIALSKVLRENNI